MPGKLTILIRPPAAGKTTWLHRFRGEAISTDDIRREEFGVQFDPRIEPAVWEIACRRLEEALAAGKDVCFDATNTTRERRRPLIKLAKKYRAAVEGIVFQQERDVLLKRNEARPPGKKVPPEVIERKLREMEIPTFAEGFDRIHFIRD